MFDAFCAFGTLSAPFVSICSPVVPLEIEKDFLHSYEELKKTEKNLITIIIPRHVERTDEIVNALNINN